MGCIQSKKIIKIENSNPNEENKNETNNVIVHNIRNDTTNENSYNINNNSVEQNNKENEITQNYNEAHYNSQSFRGKNSMNDNLSKSNYSKKEIGFYNQSMSSSEENEEIFKLTININNNLINKDIKLEDKYTIIGEESLESFFQTYKIKLIDNNSSKEEYRTMIKIEKTIFGEFASDQKIAEEVSLLSQLESRYIIKVYECFLSNKKYYYLITEYCEYGSLNEKLKSGNMYSENQIRYLVLQIFKAIKYLNSKNYLHIEISPEKILIDNIIKDSHNEELYNIKLLDFFFPSRNNMLIENNSSSFFSYMAPEVIELKYSSTCDIWSIGIIIFQMFFGDLPYKDNDDFNEYIKNIKSTYNYGDKISKELKDLLEKMLNKNPSRRITVEECLSHPWVHKQNTEIITEDEDFNRTRQSKIEQNRIKSYKSGKITNMETRQIIYYSEHNSNNSNLIEMPLNRNSSSIISNTNSFIKSNNNINKNDISLTNENISKLNDNKLDKIKHYSKKSINVHNSRKKITSFNKTKNNTHFKSEYFPKNFKVNKNNKKTIRRMSTISLDKNNEKKNQIKFPPLIDKTIDYIKYYICINFKKKRETEKITKIFHDLDNGKKNYLLYDKVNFACVIYRDNKNMSIENFNSIDKKDINNNNKKFELEEFITLLIDDKKKYVNNNFKNIFDSLKQPNLDEIIKIYNDQEAIGEYKKYVIYVKDFLKLLQENKTKKNYFFNEFKIFVDNSINKIYKNNNINIKNSNINNKNSDKSPKTNFTPNKQRIRRSKTKKFLKERKNKSKTPIKRSNTFLKNSKKEYDYFESKITIKNNEDKNETENQVNNINITQSKVYNLQFSEFNPNHFLQLTKK